MTTHIDAGLLFGFECFSDGVSELIHWRLCFEMGVGICSALILPGVPSSASVVCAVCELGVASLVCWGIVGEILWLLLQKKKNNALI